jgi:hypothetical protein
MEKLQLIHPEVKRKYEKRRNREEATKERRYLVDFDRTKKMFFVIFLIFIILQSREERIEKRARRLENPSRRNGTQKNLTLSLTRPSRSISVAKQKCIVL